MFNRQLPNRYLMMHSNLSRKGPLLQPTVHLDDPTVTRFAGLIPFFLFAEKVLNLTNRLRDASSDSRTRVSFPIQHLFSAFMAASLAGVQKLAHLELLRHDRVFQKMVRLKAWPTRKVFANALDASDQTIQGISGLLTNLGCSTIPKQQAYVLDFDTTALLAYGQQEGTCFGYNGKGRNRLRYHPIVAAIGETSAVVNASFRDGTALKAEEYGEFLLSTIEKTTACLAGPLTAIRADSGFWSRHLMQTLVDRKILFAIVHPMYKPLQLLFWKMVFVPQPDDPDLELGGVPGKEMGLPEQVSVVIIRRRVHDPKEPPQGKKANGDPDWRYQAIATTLSTDMPPVEVWRFYNHRAEIERVFRDGKQELGLGWLVSHSSRGNETAFLLRLLAMNMDILFNQSAQERATERGEKVQEVGLGYRQTRLYNLAGRLVNRGGSWHLRLTPNRMIGSLMRFYAHNLQVVF